jgi:hypothetical protein
MAAEPQSGRSRVPRPSAEAAEEALAAARTQIGPDLSVELVTHDARSVSSGLLEVARDPKATLVALGSSSAVPAVMAAAIRLPPG